MILLAMLVVGFLLYITDVKYFRHHHSGSSSDTQQTWGKEGEQDHNQPEICCGQHLICEKTSLSITNDEIIYYDDEELDRFKGRTPESYSSQETDEFRDVLLTLLPQDVAGWAKSITLREIQLPSEVRDELLLLISEMRAS